MAYAASPSLPGLRLALQSVPPAGVLKPQSVPLASPHGASSAFPKDMLTSADPSGVEHVALALSKELISYSALLCPSIVLLKFLLRLQEEVSRIIPHKSANADTTLSQVANLHRPTCNITASLLCRCSRRAPRLAVALPRKAPRPALAACPLRSRCSSRCR